MQDRGEQQQPGQQGQWPQQPGGLQPPPVPYGYQPPAPAAAAKARSKWRTPLIALLSLGVGIAIGAAAGGSKSTPATGAAGTTSSAAPSGSSPAAPAAVKSTAPAAPARKVVLQASGNGIKSTRQFTVGGEWSLKYSYDCASFGSAGNFQVSEQGGDNDGLPLANALAKKGADVTYQHSDAGTHSLSINSECSWTVTVTDGDGG
jgi:hypothetical protein